ncbi:Sulfate transport system permease protein CysW [Hartmannibacter diazotrophicus]|uniref:Sulfate transport system permease protein CysW n=1 Tax=Hartmannibacter diazotrophicus TaxID=1482074 RepID=A0A2C9D6D1_9HYPH|nr:ABC transporter permease [Hartmannibacter diazotrophicus]SON55301.1 Sulfate transport system permease protein CysW [Hartmannibacter diazotrophicus]
MQDFAHEFAQAFGLILSGDAELWAIVGLSLRVSLFAVFLAALFGMPIGALLAVGRFPGRGIAILLLNAMMGLPPVVVGLGVYLMLSNAGPLGVLHLLYTPTAMIIAQFILVTPILAALTRQVITDLDAEYAEQLRSFGISRLSSVPTLLWDARQSLLTALLAGFGRAIAEVGAVIIVGGNINHVTRVMTTTIALETSKGNLSLAMALGAILILLAITINALLSIIGASTSEAAHA